MARKLQPERRVRSTAGDNPPPLPRPYPPGHVADSPVPKGVEMQAQKLIHDAGSPALAKSAVDAAAHCETENDFLEDQFARRWGFASRTALLAASSPFVDTDGRSWWVTSTEAKGWIVWNRGNMRADQTFESAEAARRSIIEG